MEVIFEDNPLFLLENITLRKMNIDDASGVFAFNSQLENLKYVPRTPFVEFQEGVEKTESFIAQMESRFALWLTILDSDERQFLGYCGLFDIDVDARKAEIGYGLLQEFWGRGITSTATEKLVEYGFNKMNLNKIYAKIDPANVASKKVVQKLGFEKEGMLKDDAFARGQFFDMENFAKLNKNSRP